MKQVVKLESWNTFVLKSFCPESMEGYSYFKVLKKQSGKSKQYTVGGNYTNTRTKAAGRFDKALHTIFKNSNSFDVICFALIWESWNYDYTFDSYCSQANSSQRKRCDLCLRAD